MIENVQLNTMLQTDAVIKSSRMKPNRFTAVFLRLLSGVFCSCNVCPSVQLSRQYVALLHQYLNGLNGFNHHGDPPERVRASVEFSPVHSILVAAAVMASSVPNPVQVRVSTHVVPPAPLLVMSTVTCRRMHRRFDSIIQFNNIRSHTTEDMYCI